MEYIKEYIQNLSIIYLGSMLGMMSYLSIDPHTQVTLQMLWQMLLITVVFSLLQYIFYSKKPLTKKQFMMRTVVHYVSLLTVLLGGAGGFGWLSLEENGVLLGGIFTVVYIGLSITFNVIQRHQEEEMNKQLVAYKRRNLKKDE